MRWCDVFHLIQIKSPGHLRAHDGVEMPSFVRLLAFPILLAFAPSASANPAFETKAVCRTAIAVIMDRDPKLVRATDAPDGVVVLTYARPFDNFVFTYRCRLEGDRVVWADEPGRWRDGAK